MVLWPLLGSPQEKTERWPPVSFLFSAFLQIDVSWVHLVNLQHVYCSLREEAGNYPGTGW